MCIYIYIYVYTHPTSALQVCLDPRLERDREDHIQGGRDSETRPTILRPTTTTTTTTTNNNNNNPPSDDPLRLDSRVRSAPSKGIWRQGIVLKRNIIIITSIIIHINMYVCVWKQVLGSAQVRAYDDRA